MKNAIIKNSTIIAISIILVLILILNCKLEPIKAEDNILTSPEISIVGYQIKTTATPGEGIAFRTVCEAPVVGSVISLDNNKYTVKNVGTIYTKDVNTSGNNSSNVLDKSYTLLNITPYPEYAIPEGYGFKYIGQKEYLSKIVTFGYIASESGIYESKDDFCRYVRTITNMDAYVKNTMFVRAFVEATDELGNDVLIYGTYASVVSVAEIAYTVYKQGAATTAEGHEYLYNSILNKLPEYSPFYLSEPEAYGWNGGIVSYTSRKKLQKTS